MAKGLVSPKVVPSASPQIDTSIQSWIFNVRQALHFPLSILIVAGLLVAGTFVETAPRKSLEFLDTYIGKSLFFIAPLVISMVTDWPTGLLAAVVSLIIFARLHKNEVEEGFTDEIETTIVSNPQRWFIERTLGETPIAISSGRIIKRPDNDIDARTSSSSSMNTSHTSDGTK